MLVELHKSSSFFLLLAGGQRHIESICELIMTRERHKQRKAWSSTRGRRETHRIT
jgi:hypothetical protein